MKQNHKVYLNIKTKGRRWDYINIKARAGICT